MSLPRAPNPFRTPSKTRHYSRLACQLSGSTIPRGSNRIVTTTTTPPTSTPGPGTRPAFVPQTNPKRAFHTTPSLSAAPRSPRIRHSERARATRNPIFSDDGLYTGGVKNVADDIPTRLETLQKLGPKLWRSSIIEGFVDESVDRKTFMRIADLLLKAASYQAPSAVAIEPIHPDPNLVFDIGNVVGANSPSLMQWIISSTAQAGAVIPTLISVGRALAAAERTGPHTLPSSTRRSAIFQTLETLVQNGDPRAMLLQTKNLGLQQRYEEAEHLLTTVLKMIHPSKTPPPPSRSMTLAFLDTPWTVSIWLKRRMGRPESEIQDIQRLAALEYQDPQALIAYAGHVRTAQNDLPLYEECMAKAATSGNADACRKLANFYYLTSRGRFPRRGTTAVDPEEEYRRATEAAQNRGPLATFLAGLFGPQPYREYRGLAIEWYELAARHGCPKAALALAILMRENGDERELVEQVFQAAVASKGLAGLVRSVRVNWEREDYVPVVPEEVLDL